MRNALTLLAWIALTAVAAAVGALSQPGPWYTTLAKPSWTPPPWLFGPVWTVLYLMMAFAAWLAWRKTGWRGYAIPLFLLQLALNAAWSPLFFGLQRPGLAALDILCLLGALSATIIAFSRISRPAAWLLAPYFLWVSFATALNLAIWHMNS